jgi:hypothetical protein
MEKNIFRFTNYDVSEENGVLPEEAQHNYTDEDISIAHRSGFEQGYAKGHEEGVQEGHRKSNEEIHRSIQLQLKNISEKLSQILAEQSVQSTFLEKNSLFACQAIFQKILPLYMEKNMNNEMLNKVKMILSHLRQKQPIVMKIHPEREVFIKENLQMLLPGVFQDICIETIGEMHPFDFDIYWDQGGARWSMNEVIEKIEKIMLSNINTQENEVTL